MDIGIEVASLEQRESYLTVVRGCLATVLAHWDRLDDEMKKTLLQTGLDKVEDLVVNLEHDVRPLRLSELETRGEPGSARTA